MSTTISSKSRQIAIAVGGLTTVVWFCFTWRYGFGLADEGYYWYGAQRLLHGEIPMRDYMAYDIGRYAWSAAVMWLAGDDDIFAARLAAGLFQLCTVTVGVLLALRGCKDDTPVRHRVAFAAIAAILLNLWAYPYYKVFDYGASILIVAMLVLMLTSQSSKHWLYAGLLLGWLAIIGRNHGVYGAFGALALLGILAVKKRGQGLLRPTSAFMAGTAIGFSPTFLLAIFVDGFGIAFVGSIQDMLSSGATNIALPIPWPWIHSASELGWFYWSFNVLKGLGFIALIVVPVLMLLLRLRKSHKEYTPADVLVLCAALAAIPYAHYAYSRADLIHLALAIAPLLLIFFGLGSQLKRPMLLCLALAGASIIALCPENLLLSKLLLGRPLASISINGSTLIVSSGERDIVRDFERVLATAPEVHDNVLAIPNAPGIYAVNKKKMYLWEIYALWPRDPEFEARELARLRAYPPRLVIMSNHALDGREELRYSRTHPLMYRWIMSNYQWVRPLSNSNGNSYQVYTPRFDALASTGSSNE